MKPIPIPVVSAASLVLGPGLQPAGETALDYLDMPHGMNTFAMPRIPETADVRAMGGARDLLAELLGRLTTWRPGDADYPSLDLKGVDRACCAVVNDVTGEGEVGIRLAGPREVRIQETVFAGIWRVCRFDEEGQLADDRLEGCAIPDIVRDTALRGAVTQPAAAEIPEGAMNAPALLYEIREQMKSYCAGRPAHVINFTLLPLAPEDHACLERALPPGPVAIISRGFGNCRISSTGARNVWRVQYFNNMQTLILDTLEIVDVPEVALAAAEDIADSRERLAELVAWMSESASA